MPVLEVGLLPYPKDISGISFSSTYSGFFNSNTFSIFGSSEYKNTLFSEAKPKRTFDSFSIGLNFIMVYIGEVFLKIIEV